MTGLAVSQRWSPAALQPGYNSGHNILTASVIEKQRGREREGGERGGGGGRERERVGGGIAISECEVAMVAFSYVHEESMTWGGGGGGEVFGKRNREKRKRGVTIQKIGLGQWVVEETSKRERKGGRRDVRPIDR